jgi:hypothetical protein
MINNDAIRQIFEAKKSSNNIDLDGFVINRTTFLFLQFIDFKNTYLLIFLLKKVDVN